MAQRLVTVEIGEGAILYEPQSRRVHELNATGRYLVAAVERGRDVEAAARDFERLPDAPSSSVLVADCRSFMQSLNAAGVFRESDVPADQHPLIERPLSDELPDKLQYEPPSVTTRSEAEIRAEHPDAFTEVHFSDIWTDIVR